MLPIFNKILKFLKKLSNNLHGRLAYPPQIAKVVAS